MFKIIVNGPARAGKDTFVTYCLAEFARQHGMVGFNCSSVDQVKSAARLLGWDGEKDARGRQFLSDLKDLSTRIYNGPMKYMNDVIKESCADVGFFHIREPEEIARFVAEHDAITVHVSSNRAEAHDNHADGRTGQYVYRYYIDNHGTLNDLRWAAKQFVACVAVAP